MGDGRNRREKEQRVIAAIDQLRELLAIAEGVKGAFVAGVQVEDLRLALLELDAEKAESKRLRRLATDNAYMRDSYHAMLMPTGLKVAEMWKAQGVQRQHTSWGDNAWLLNGEERAQCILDWDAAPRREVLPGEIDGRESSHGA